eukprot:124103-Pyramimonas_sp.AAC.1
MKINGCADMRVYCDDPTHGSIARQMCPFTCGVCQVAGCLVTDGTGRSSAYPCACGSRTCFTNELCTLATSQCHTCVDDDAEAIKIASGLGLILSGCADVQFNGVNL